jgi:predicted DNA-binding transcriptional regulator YafY
MARAASGADTAQDLRANVIHAGGAQPPPRIVRAAQGFRLLDLLQLLRRHRAPVTGPALARELGISIRTLYRDIATMQAQGADIQGEPGIGYMLRPGFTLPPLMFSSDEIEALVLCQDYRGFRVDRIAELETTNARFPRRRAVMVKEWRAKQGLSTTAGN